MTTLSSWSSLLATAALPSKSPRLPSSSMESISPIRLVYYEETPRNFELIVYDGYELPIPDNTIDVVFSDQLIEHFHPDDTLFHFRLVRRILKPGGVYVFRTPHGFSGPHDISQYFCHSAKGFHLKEWTYVELSRLLHQVG